MIIDFTFDVESPSDSFDNHAFQIGFCLPNKDMHSAETKSSTCVLSNRAR
jgi:hypothetical protein